MQDGGPELGPKWSKVMRRVTTDMHSGVVLDDINPKGMSLDDLTALSGMLSPAGGIL